MANSRFAPRHNCAVIFHMELLSKFEETACIVCGSREGHKVADLKDRFQTFDDERFTIVRCKCGFHYLNPRPSEEQIGPYYENDAYDPHASGSLFQRIYGIVQFATLRWKYHILSKFLAPARLLDIGGGKGEFAEFMQKRGWETTLFDSSKDALELARKRGIDVIGHLSDASNNSKEMVSLWHALEHIHNVSALFLQIDRILVPRGMLVIAVPNFESIDRIAYNEDWAPMDAPRHLYHFSPKDLQQLLENHGYETMQIFAMPQDTIYNVLLSMKGFSAREIWKATQSILNTLWKSLFSVNNASSILVLARKVS